MDDNKSTFVQSFYHSALYITSLYQYCHQRTKLCPCVCSGDLDGLYGAEDSKSMDCTFTDHQNATVLRDGVLLPHV